MTLTRSGELLKEARVKKGLTFEEIERETKIRAKFLKALEAGDFAVFHSIAYARGLLKNYCEFLGLDPQMVLALFRRETTTQAVSVLPQGMVAHGSSPFRITPARSVGFIVVIAVLAIGYYLFQEYRGFLGAPVLFLDTPKEETTVGEGEIEVKGKTDIDATVAINGELVIVDESGNFAKKIRVFKGGTTVTVVARNRRGKETTLTRHIKVE